MKSIILFLVSIVILSGCKMGSLMGPDDKWGSRGYTILFTGKAVVKMESGKPCQNAMIPNNSPYYSGTNSSYYADSTGTIIVRYKYKKYPNQINPVPEIMAIHCSVYPDTSNISPVNPIYIRSMVYLKRGSIAPPDEYTLYVTFPDSLFQ